MPELKLIEAVENGEIDRIKSLLNEGVDIEQKDDYGWTALNWAAGKGNTSIVEILLSAGANISNVGRDKRTAYQIALAAAHIETASALQKAEQKAFVDMEMAVRLYCRAYLITELRQFSDWHELLSGLTEDAIVFMHQDFSVTRSMFHGKDVVFNNISSSWKTFCKNQLAFAVPSDLELAASFAASKSAETHQSLV
ncbi:MAG: ankyrin repeat domain-containing protein [Methylococcaceae bacterium]|nr:ankyrin repeat domain-containing protein [Methylococcaceae bacterium]